MLSGVSQGRPGFTCQSKASKTILLFHCSLKLVENKFTNYGFITICIDLILKTRGNNLKSLAKNFQVAIQFHPSHLQPKTLGNSFNALIVNNNGPLFLGFPRHKINIYFSFSKNLEVLKTVTEPL